MAIAQLFSAFTSVSPFVLFVMIQQLVELPGIQFSFDDIAQYYADICEDDIQREKCGDDLASSEPVKQQTGGGVEECTHQNSRGFIFAEAVGFVKVLEQIGLHIADDVIGQNDLQQRDDPDALPSIAELRDAAEKYHAEEIHARLEVNEDFIDKRFFYGFFELLFHR